MSAPVTDQCIISTPSAEVPGNSIANILCIAISSFMPDR